MKKIIIKFVCENEYNLFDKTFIHCIYMFVNIFLNQKILDINNKYFLL